MTKKRQAIKKPPLWIVVTVIISMFIGIFSAIIGINKIQNYYHPYLFGLIFCCIGLIIGLWIAKKVRTYIAVNPKIKSNYGTVVWYISAGFLGIFLMIGSFVNQSLSNIDKCDSFPVIDKYRKESGFRHPEINSLVVSINGKSQRLICSRDYWLRISVGQSIDVCLHKSKLGFDFITVENNERISNED